MAPIRVATLDDAPQILEIYAPYVLTTSVTFEVEVPTVEEYRERIAKTLKFFPFFVMEDEHQQIVAYAYASFYAPRAAYRWTVESSIYVDGNLRGRGYGTVIYKVLLDTLRDMGVYEVWASLGCPNEASERFHVKMGFVKKGFFPLIGYKLGEWHDVVYYSYCLRDHVEGVTPAEPIPFHELDASKYVAKVSE
jgi:phosphinothricin acetyltransferase